MSQISEVWVWDKVLSSTDAQLGAAVCDSSWSMAIHIGAYHKKKSSSSYFLPFLNIVNNLS